MEKNIILDDAISYDTIIGLKVFVQDLLNAKRNQKNGATFFYGEDGVCFCFKDDVRKALEAIANTEYLPMFEV